MTTGTKKCRVVFIIAEYRQLSSYFRRHSKIATVNGQTYHGIKSWMKNDVTIIRDGEGITVDTQLRNTTQHRHFYSVFTSIQFTSLYLISRQSP